MSLNQGIVIKYLYESDDYQNFNAELIYHILTGAVCYGYSYFSRRHVGEFSCKVKLLVAI